MNRETTVQQHASVSDSTPGQVQAQTGISTRIWPYMIDMYGHTWIRAHGSEDKRGTWTAVLKKFNPVQIKQALADCLRLYPDWPPTLGQFRALAKMAPNPDAPIQLEAPQSENEQNNAELLHMLADAKDAGPMTDDQRDFHIRVLGLDADSQAKKAVPYMQPGSSGACAYPGCSRPGAITNSDGGRWYCCDHFKAE